MQYEVFHPEELERRFSPFASRSLLECVCRNIDLLRWLPDRSFLD